jgi:putative transcription factor
MEHQDWEVYIMNAKKSSSTNSSSTKSNEKKKHKDVPKSVKLEKQAENDELKHKTIPRDISQVIQKARLEKKLKQKDLAKMMNVNVSVINDIETGKALYNGKQITMIKRKLGIK